VIAHSVIILHLTTLNLRVLFTLCSLSILSESFAQDSLIAPVRHERKFLKAITVPAVLIASGLIVIDKDNDADFFINRYWVRNERNKSFSNFHTIADNYLQYSPAMLVYGLDIAGVKGKHDVRTQTQMLIKSELIMLAIVLPLKSMTHVLRPDGSNYHSFPSGHTAQAFAAATFLHKEYGGKSIWYSVGGFTAAAAVGTCRILNNKHWLSDVLAGAGIGIFSTNIAYLMQRSDKHKKLSTTTLLPTYNRGVGVYFCHQFR
jgi:PAP2 superfamily